MQEKKKFRMNVHLIFLAIVVIIVVFAVVKLMIWDKGAKDDTDLSIDNPEFDIESMDYILPLNPSLLEGREDDGVLRIVCLGNAPFADDRGEEDNLCNLIEKEMGENTVVYNCSVQDSYMTALNPTLTGDHPYDAFSFYWLTTLFTVGNTAAIDSAVDALEEAPEELLESIDILKSIDFESVDVITIMYDASDYLAGRRTINSDNETDIQHFTGALTAGIQLIQETYPHIRIMVMSPAYAFALDENGEEVSSDIMDYGMGSLATYAILESNVCYENSVTFIDNIYGSIHADNARTYLTDYIHINEKGRRLIAKRFAECYKMYQGVSAENE